MSLLLLFIGYYLKQNNLFQRIKKQKWEEEDVKKKVRFWKENSSSTKNAGTHTHESVSARRGDARNGKKKASSPTRRHTTLEKSKKDKVILGFEPNHPN
jgi:hypothetical protein